MTTAPRVLLIVAGAACSLLAATCSNNLDPIGIRPTGIVPDASTDIPIESSIDASVDSQGASADAFAGTLSGQAEDCFIVESTYEVRWRLIGPAGLPDGGTESATYFPGAIGGLYLQALAVAPNTGEHEFPEPGSGPLLLCPVFLPQAGRYQVWVRAYARNTTDNSMHVGMDNLWPATGRALQVCQSADVFNQWTWTSSQYLENSSETCVGPRAISLDVNAPGQHLLMFSVREDDFRFDAWLMTLDQEYDPNLAF
jgi:hypothetical protein